MYNNELLNIDLDELDKLDLDELNEKEIIDLFVVLDDFNNYVYQFVVKSKLVCKLFYLTF